MPDLARERRLRASYNFTDRATFRVDVGGERDETGRYQPAIETWTAWCRREDVDAEEGQVAFGEVLPRCRVREAGDPIRRAFGGPHWIAGRRVHLRWKGLHDRTGGARGASSLPLSPQGTRSMIWPWSPRRETRASSYTDALVAAITANASGQTTAFPTATAALEACAGLIGRAFASAVVRGPDRVQEALTPNLLCMVGRALIRRGEYLAAIDVVDGQLRLWPAASHDVDGSFSSWSYRLNLAGPSEQATRENIPAEGVIRVSYAVDVERPWKGYGPLQVAQLAGRLSAETVAALADEASGPRGSVLPLPRVGRAGRERKGPQGRPEEAEQPIGASGADGRGMVFRSGGTRRGRLDAEADRIEPARVSRPACLSRL